MKTAFEAKLPELEEIQESHSISMKGERSLPEKTQRFYDVTPFNVGTLAINLEFFPADAEVKFGDKEYPNLEINSWRGAYEASTLGRNGSTPVTVSDMVAALKWHVGKVQVGYKGGYFEISEESPLWAEWDSGSYDRQFVSGLRYDPEKNTVWILTARDEREGYY